jgi:hypothetical protein
VFSFIVDFSENLPFHFMSHSLSQLPARRLVSLAAASSMCFATSSLIAGVDFTKVQAVLESKCLECHNPSKIKGDLLMHTAEAMLKGGEGGAALVPGKPEESSIIQRVVLPADDDDVMPPKGGPLKSEEIALLKQWVAEGAVWPKGVALRHKSPEEIKAIAALSEKLPQLTKVEIFPDKYTLETARDFHRVVVMATFNDATTRDVTLFSNLHVADANVAKLEQDVLKPVAENGTTELVASLGGQTVKATVSVKEGKKDRPVSYHLDVMPVWLRGGCNQGGCHGAARGKDGFRLSLFGFDPDGDHHRLRLSLRRQEQ